MAIQLANNENFENLTREGFVIVDFFSTTCIPCKMFSKILEDLEGEIPFINIVKVNTTDYPELGDKYKIQAVPTMGSLLGLREIDTMLLYLWLHSYLLYTS